METTTLSRPATNELLRLQGLAVFIHDHNFDRWEDIDDLLNGFE